MLVEFTTTSDAAVGFNCYSPSDCGDDLWFEMQHPPLLVYPSPCSLTGPKISWPLAFYFYIKIV